MHKVIDIKFVTKVEICTLKTEADMYLYEIYYINTLKPTLNRDDKANDGLSVILPELEWKEYNPPRMAIWLKDIVEKEEAERVCWQEQNKRLDERQKARRELKGDAYHDWLDANGY